MVVYWHRTSFIPLVAAVILSLSGALALVFSAGEPRNVTASEESFSRPNALVEEAVSDVEAILVTPTQFPHCVEADGRVKAARDVNIVARVGGTVKEVRVRNGDCVAEGEVIAKLDDREYRLDFDKAASLLLGAQIEYRSLAGATVGERLDPADSSGRLQREQDSIQAASLAYRAGRLTYEEYRRLVRDYESSIAYIRAHRSDVIAYKSGLVQARDAFERARLNLEATAIQAPFRGTVADCALVPGMSITSGTSLCRLVDRGRVVARVDVLESDVQKLNVGDSSRVGFPLFRETGYQGVVIEVNPVVEPETRTMHATIEVLPPSVNAAYFLESHPPGSSVHAIIEVERVDSCLVVPTEAILMRDGRQVVFAVSANRAVWRYVRVGREENNFVELLDGVSARDTVIVTGHTVLAHQAKIKIVRLARGVESYQLGKRI